LNLVIYDDGEYYEHTLTKVFQNILKHAPANSRVLDVGGNIGWFTLLSAAMGHHVDVFEPNTVNVIRQCQSMRLNRWSNVNDDDVIGRRTVKQGSINIRQYGVGSNTTTMPLFIGKNPGKATLMRNMLPKKHLKGDGSYINIVTLDSMAHDLGWFGPNKAANIIILKVDVEGFEPSVFAGAKKLLKSGLIENILMEVSGQNDNSENEKMLKLILDSGYYLHDVGGPEGPTGKKAPAVSDENLPKILLSSFARQHTMQANLWWKWKGTKSAS
jgi:FkbM family methyltransferase